MTDAEIIKALECCTNSLDCPADCPLYEYAGYCFLALHKPTLDLINRQKTEIERLKTLAELGNMRANDYRVMRDRALRAEADVEWLKKIRTTVNDFWVELQGLSIAKGKEKPTLEELLEYIEQAKAEAIREFAERLKERTKMPIGTLYGKMVYIKDIDNLVKEMVGEG
jgi:hypothetical protein